MELYKVLIVAIVEGITEFLPVSSTFHMILASSILGIPQTDFTKLFEVFIQAGAILSVVILYWKTLVEDRRLMLRILASFVPTAVIGLVLYKVIKNVFFETPALMIAMFAAVGVAFFIAEYLVRREKITLKSHADTITWKQAVIVGVVQALAVIPGVSRAGAVIIGMMFFGFRRDEAARYSFLLAVPTIFAASALDLFKMRGTLAGNPDYVSYLVLGFLVAFASSFVFVKWFINYLRTNTLIPFGWYRIVLTVLIAVMSLMGVMKFS